MKEILQRKLLELSKNHQLRFRIVTGIKFACIPTFTVFLTVIVNYIVLRVSIIALDSLESDVKIIAKDILFLYFEKSLIDVIPWLILTFLILMCLGVFLANIMIRPFKVIANYCDNQLNGVNSSYDPDFLTDLKLLSSFSEWFFNALNVIKQSGKLHSVDIPEKYKKIHRPVFESSFFLHNFLVVIITSLLTGILIHYTNFKIYAGVEEVVAELFRGSVSQAHFMAELSGVLLMVSNIAISVNILSYILFMFYLYSHVSTPAFGVFATMRSFITGNYAARVHLIGFPYLRKDTRTLNKYLDSVQNEYFEKDN